MSATTTPTSGARLRLGAAQEVVHADDAWARVGGPLAAEVTGRSLPDVVAPWHARAVLAALTAARLDDAPAAVVVAGRCGDGRPWRATFVVDAPADRDVEVVVLPVGGPTHWIGTEPPVEPSVRSLDTVLSHDVRGALRTATNFAGLARRSLAEGEAADTGVAAANDRLGTVERAVTTADEIVAAVVELERLRERPLLVDRVPLPDVVATAVDLADRREPGDPPRLVLAAPDGPPIVLAVAPDVVSDAIAELVVNARRFAGAAPVTIAAVDGPAGWAVLEVRDQGPGLESALLDEAFAPGRQLVPRGQVPGHGLGLARVRAIAERHAGYASLATAGPGATGTVASLALPTAPPRPVG